MNPRCPKCYKCYIPPKSHCQRAFDEKEAIETQSAASNSRRSSPSRVPKLEFVEEEFSEREK